MANGGGTDGRKDGRTDGRMEIPPCVLQDIGPLGPLPKKERDRVGRPQKFIGPFCRQTFLVGPGLITKTEEDTD